MLLFMVACTTGQQSEDKIEKPRIESVEITPTDVFSTSELFCQATIANSSEQDVSLNYNWFQGESLLGEGDSLLLHPEIVQPTNEISCVATVSFGTEHLTESTSVVVQNTTPQIESLLITPDAGVFVDTELLCQVTARDEDAEELNISYQWTRDDALLGEGDSIVLNPSLISKGDGVSCIVTVKDSYGGERTESVSVTIENTSPILTEIAILPESPNSQDTLICQVHSFDIDDDLLSFTYEWNVDNVLQNETTNQLEGPHEVGANISCESTPFDGDSSGESSIAITQIRNTPPTIENIQISPSTIYADTLIQCDAEASDFDGEDVAIAYRWLNSANIELGQGAALQLSPDIAPVGEQITCLSIPSDPHVSGEELGTENYVLNTSPHTVVDALITTETAATNGVLDCSAEIHDLDDGVLPVDYQWLINNTVLSNSSTYTISSVETDPGETIICKASATDLQGATEETYSSITIQNTPPQITSLALTPDTIFSQDDVTCSVQSMDLDDQVVDISYVWTIDDEVQLEQSNILEGPFDVGAAINCSAVPTDGLSDGMTVQQELVVQNTPPVITNISFNVVNPKTNDLITAIPSGFDVDEHSILFSYQWFVNDVLVYTGSESLDGSLYFDKGDEVYVVITPNDSISDGDSVVSSSITIANTPPELSFIEMDLPIGEIGDSLNCIVGSSTDVDGDIVSYHYKWIDPNLNVVQEVQASSNDFNNLENATVEGDWTCQVTPFDGISLGEPVEVTVSILENCSFELTDWSEISSELYDIEHLLPNLPSTPLTSDWEEPIHEMIIHSISPDERNGETPNTLSCDVPSFWDQERIEMGPFVDGENPHCRVQLKEVNPNDVGLYAFNRHRWSQNTKISSEPAWVQFRYPIPPNHQAKRFRYEVNWARLFGSSPSACHSDDQDENGNCTLDALDTNDLWNSDVPAGLFILWGEAGTCGGWTISGPHEPIDNIEYSGTTNYTIDVPEEVQNVDELTVTFFVYHQYPGGCENGNCISGKSSPFNIAFHGADLFTEQIFEPSHEPPTEHPRLFGDNQEWMTEQQKFEQMECLGSEWPINSDWGGLTNIHNNWDLITKGGMTCESDVPISLLDVEFAIPYFDGTANWNVTNAVKVLHLIRRERACQETGIGTCWFDSEDVDDLAAAFIEIEMNRLPSIVWNTFSFEFDLRTREPMRVYTLMADVLWDDLTPEQHQELQDAMDEQIDGYLRHFDETHWAVFNGNNWTPVLAEGALYWAITYYYEDERAPDVARLALYSLWLHRHSYLDDGVYNEGLLMYSQVSFDPLIHVSRLAEFGFGIHIMSPPWERMESFSEWALAFMGTDGYTIDFGDSWAKKGWGTFMPLLAHMVNPVSGIIDQEPDPCFAYQFFNNKYYYYGITDPWSVHPALSQNWPQILSDCPTGNQLLSGIEVGVWDTGGWGSIRIGMPNSTTIGSQVTNGPSLYAQHDQVMVATSAIPNTASHTELDFGTLVWLAYGNRLLVDFGYGSIGNKQYRTYPDYDTFDNNPMAHNTLVIPEAYEDEDFSTNTSQIDGEVGIISEYELDGHKLISLDGSAVYGRDNVELGWLEYFERTLIPFDDGNILIVDSILVRSDRGLISPEEYWLTYTGDFSSSTCSSGMSGTHKIFDDDNVTLLPTCSTISKYDMAESAGRIFGTALEGGSFVEMPDISLINRLNQLDSKSQFKWTPDNPQDSDIRIFALHSAVSEDDLAMGEWVWDSCEVGNCATLFLDSEEYVRLSFEESNGAYILTNIETFSQ